MSRKNSKNNEPKRYNLRDSEIFVPSMLVEIDELADFYPEAHTVKEHDLATQLRIAQLAIDTVDETLQGEELRLRLRVSEIAQQATTVTREVRLSWH